MFPLQKKQVSTRDKMNRSTKRSRMAADPGSSSKQSEHASGVSFAAVINGAAGGAVDMDPRARLEEFSTYFESVVSECGELKQR